MVACIVTSNAATMIVNNIVDYAAGDTLYAKNNGALMNSGLVTIGYFAAGITQTQIDTVPELYAQLLAGSFTLVTSAIPGSSNPFVESVAGYASQEVPTSIGAIATGNALIGRTVYSIVTDANIFTVGSGAGQINGGSNFALLSVGTIINDTPFEGAYDSNPKGITPIIGAIGSHNGSPGGTAGEGAYTTLQMAIPETSSVLLGALGALGLLRRRR